MFNSHILTEKFFDILDDSRNLSYKNYDKEKKEGSFWLPYCHPKELTIELDRCDFDSFYELGRAIKSGDFGRVSAVLNGGHRTTIDVKFVSRCFTRSNYEGRGNAKLVAESLSNYANASGGTAPELARLMVKDHPTLQQAKMRIFVQFCEEMATLDGFTDARNEASVQFAKRISLLMKEEGIYLPFI